MNLEFRKWLTSHGITKEEYESMTEVQQEQMMKAYQRELGDNVVDSAASCMEAAGSLLIMIAITVFFFMWFF